MLQEIDLKLGGKSILITGSTGFIGRNLISFLTKTDSFKQQNLRIICSGRNPDRLALIHPIVQGIEHFVWDIKTEAERAPKQIDYVIHLAGEDRFWDTAFEQSQIITTSVNGTTNVLNLVDRVCARKMLLASSGAVYPLREQIISPILEDDYSPSTEVKSIDPYTVGKRKSEQLCFEFSQSHGGYISIARLFTLIGPNFPITRPFAIGEFIRMCLRNEPIVVRGSSSVVRSYQNVQDTSRWLMTILLSDDSENIFNVGDSSPISMPDLAHMVAEVCENQHPIQFSLDDDFRTNRNYYVPDISKAKKILGLTNLVSIEDSIIETYRSFAKRTP
jgi:nucleoside-diphosphate-sugar epimerase